MQCKGYINWYCTVFLRNNLLGNKMFVHVPYRCNLFPNIFSPWSVDSRGTDTTDTHDQLYMYPRWGRCLQKRRFSARLILDNGMWAMALVLNPMAQFLSLPLLSTLRSDFLLPACKTTQQTSPLTTIQIRNKFSWKLAGWVPLWRHTKLEQREIRWVEEPQHHKRPLLLIPPPLPGPF